MPIPTDPELVFDHGAADAAAEACEAMAAELRHATAEREGLASAATREWSGGHRRDFDTTSRALDAHSHELSVRLTATAAAIRARAHLAQTEQQARDAAAQQAPPEAADGSPLLRLP